MTEAILIEKSTDCSPCAIVSETIRCGFCDKANAKLKISDAVEYQPTRFDNKAGAVVPTDGETMFRIRMVYVCESCGRHAIFRLCSPLRKSRDPNEDAQ